MKKMVLGLLLIGMAWGQQPWPVEWGLRINTPPPTRLDGQKLQANVGATAGANDYYYWVVVNYPVGSMSPVGPREVLNITAPAPGNTVILTWPAQLGATNYTVIRQTTPNFPATCAGCAVTTANTTVTDNGALFVNAFTATGIDPATTEILLNNRGFENPFLTLEYELGQVDDGRGTLDWSDRTGDIRIYNARVSADFSTVTNMRGTDIRVTSTGGDTAPLGTLSGGQFVAFVNPGTTSMGEVYGSNSVVLHQAGSSVNAFGAVGNIQFSGATNTGGSLYNVGVYGQIDDSTGGGISIPGTNFTTAVMGVVDNSGAPTRGIDAAFMAVMTAGTPTAAFMAVERNANPGRHFEYGLDLQGTTGFNDFGEADIRGEQGDEIDNGTAGAWGFVNDAGTAPANVNAGQVIATTDATFATTPLMLDVDGGASGFGVPAVTIGSTGTLLWVDNADIVAGTWDVALTRGAAGRLTQSSNSDFNGFQFGGLGTTFADLGTPPNGTMTYCSNCDPTGGAAAGCTSAGAQSGAWAFRINGNWDCISQ